MTLHRPLVVFTPKSMLRRKEAASQPEDFTEGTFRPVVPDEVADPEKVDTLLLCSGRITWDLMVERTKRRGLPTTAIARVEQLYPRPTPSSKAEIARYPNLKEMRWVQDEPANMGPAPYFRLNLFPTLDLEVEVLSRPASSSPSVGAALAPRRGAEGPDERGLRRTGGCGGRALLGPAVYFTDRGIEELQSRRGEEEVTLAWVAERLRSSSTCTPSSRARRAARHLAGPPRRPRGRLGTARPPAGCCAAPPRRVPATGRTAGLRTRVPPCRIPPPRGSCTASSGVSLFRVRAGDHPDRPPGVYGAALISYEEPSPLTYGELLVATRPPAQGPRHRHLGRLRGTRETAGASCGRSRRSLASLRRDHRGRPLSSTPPGRSTSTGRPVALGAASPTSPASAPRTAFSAATWQVRESGEPVVAPIRGSARSLPCRAHWNFEESGPLGWLAGKRALASFRMTDVAMSFG